MEDLIKAVIDGMSEEALFLTKILIEKDLEDELNKPDGERNEVLIDFMKRSLEGGNVKCDCIKCAAHKKVENMIEKDVQMHLTGQDGRCIIEKTKEHLVNELSDVERTKFHFATHVESSSRKLKHALDKYVVDLAAFEAMKIAIKELKL